MAHLTDGTLRRMVDDPDARVGSDAAHLDTCADCQSRFKTFSDDAQSIAKMLAVPTASVDVARAFEHVMREPKARAVLGIRLPVMPAKARPVTLGLVAAVTAAALAVVAFAASGFFYKPTTVTAVPVTLADVEALSQLAEYGTITWTKQPTFATSTTAAEAATTAGFAAPELKSGYQLPSGISPNVTYVAMSDAVATFTFSASKASAAAARHGQTLPPMPSGIDGATLTITVGPAAGVVYGNLPSTAASSVRDISLPQLVIAKSAAPTVTSTQVTVIQLRDYILQQPGISADLKKAITDIGDPSNKLFVPVPASYATSSPFTVRGAKAGDGLALGDNTGVGSGVVWISSGDGYVYVVAGSVRQDDAKSIANNLK